MNESEALNALTLAISNMIDENIATDVVAIEETTRAAIQVQISNGIKDSMTVSKIAQAVDDVFNGFNEIRALRIARTEIATASSFGQFASAVSSGMTHKTWETASDATVRDSHAHMQGETVGMFENFSNGALFPADALLAVGERVNCRCSMTFSVKN